MWKYCNRMLIRTYSSNSASARPLVRGDWLCVVDVGSFVLGWISADNPLTNLIKMFVLGRARKKIDDLERLTEVAKNNFRQLGGKLQEDKKKSREIKEAERFDAFA